ncbi:MAG: glycoside hydrolase [Deinococcus sp.]
MTDLTSTALAAQLTIHPQQTQQRMDGFGASGGWWAQMVGQHPESREQVLDWLHHPTRGLGLTIYRHNLGAGVSSAPDPWRRAETNDLVPGEADWNRDAAAIACLTGAVARGVSDVVLFANSPTDRLTLSRQADGHPQGKSNLRPGAGGAFAHFLVDAAQHFLTRLKRPSVWLSPINEPQWDWQPAKGQEGCHYTPEECADLAWLVLAELAARDETRVKLSLIDSATWHTAPPYLAALLARPEVRAAMLHFSVHSYFNDAAQKARALEELHALAPALPLWMSEWTEMRAGRDLGMDSALNLAREMHDDLTLGGVTSWQAWIAVSKYDFRDGLIYVDAEGQHPQATKRLWALGQFSRFVRPGDRRVEVTVSGDLPVSAYISADGESLSAVMVNAGEAMNLRLNVPEGFTPSSARLVVTDAEHDLAEVWCGPAQSGRTVLLPARSVSTLIFARRTGGERWNAISR